MGVNPPGTPAVDPFRVFGGPVQVWVSAIDDENLTATLEVRLPRPVPVAGPAISLTGPDAGGGGLVWIGGKLHHIGPRSPALALLEQVVALGSATMPGVPPALQLQLQQYLLTAIATSVAEQLDDTKISRHAHEAER